MTYRPSDKLIKSPRIWKSSKGWISLGGDIQTKALPPLISRLIKEASQEEYEEAYNYFSKRGRTKNYIIKDAKFTQSVKKPDTGSDT